MFFKETKSNKSDLFKFIKNTLEADLEATKREDILA